MCIDSIEIELLKAMIAMLNLYEATKSDQKCLKQWNQQIENWFQEFVKLRLNSQL